MAVGIATFLSKTLGECNQSNKPEKVSY